MKIIKKVSEMQNFSCKLKAKNLSIGFVPTMGYLHEGHVSLMRQAKLENDFLVISIFVNPLQFAPTEDLKQYPRDFKHDLKIAKDAGVDVIFFPDAKQMYPSRFLTEVYVNDWSKIICGLSRPTHFKGVATVVAKLFNTVLPDVAYFGQKDFQQARIIQKMTSDLNFALTIKIMPIIREFDGLAMSSRNVNLSKTARLDALILNQALEEATMQIHQGERRAKVVSSTIKNLISSVKSAKIDYVEIVDTLDLKRKVVLDGEFVILLAVKIANVRLIDNKIIKI
jgi:pantoate--beta-alanine ligase